MIFHLGTDLPQKVPDTLDHESADLTAREMQIVKDQIRKNSRLIGEYLAKLDLFVNKEKHPPQEAFLNKIRQRLDLLMEENDTFRAVLWKHFQQAEMKNSR